MAPTVFRVWNFRVVIYPRDHFPPHVHVIGPNAHAKFTIGNFELIESYGLDEKSIKKLQEYLLARKQKLLETWNDYQE